jgi:cytochrome c oxidase subunit IV
VVDESAKDRRAQVRRHIDRSIRLRVTIYSVIFLVMTVIVVVDVLRIGGGAVLPVLLCLAGGLVVGLVVSRMFRIGWDAVSERVVGRIDVVGVVILVLYIAFSIFRGRLVGLWVDAPVVGVASLTVLAGVMAGQSLGTRQGVIRVFRILRGQQPG